MVKYLFTKAQHKMKNFNKFQQQTIKQLRLWAWIAATLPLVSLAGIFFIWTYGNNTAFDIALIVGETTMFAVAVVWWWWSLYAISKLVRHWDDTREVVAEVLAEIREINQIVKDQISVDTDK